MTNTDNASGAGMEPLTDTQLRQIICHITGANRFSETERLIARAVESGIRTDASRLLAEKEGELQRLRQGLWDVYAALGCDTDGDPTPIALVSDIVELVVSAAKEARQDYDAALKP